jgi:diaminohydroxyphosphoribosylaminopyrimidine deaminase/5-amino-6-(5-phosphoribosylamino)uracil reductase
VDTQQTIDEQFMQEALALAAQARGRTSRTDGWERSGQDGRVVGRGYHAKAGAPHGEVVALRTQVRRRRGQRSYHPRTLLPLRTL